MEAKILEFVEELINGNVFNYYLGGNKYKYPGIDNIICVCIGKQYCCSMRAEDLKNNYIYLNFNHEKTHFYIVDNRYKDLFKDKDSISYTGEYVTKYKDGKTSKVCYSTELEKFMIPF